MIQNEIVISILAECTSVSDTSTIDADATKCDAITSSANKEIWLDDIKLAKELQAKIASATPYVVCPVTILWMPIL